MPLEPDADATGRTIPDPGFAGDDGSAPAHLATALAAYASDPGRHLEVFLALRTARLLVPVLAVPGDAAVDGMGRVHEKPGDVPGSSGVEMATVLITGRDGRQALLAFSSVQSLAAWRAEARPVPVAAPLVALSALDGGVPALLVDVAGPTTYVVEGELLEGLARRWAVARTSEGLAWVEEIGADEE